MTAVEPSPAMRDVLKETLAAEGIRNVEVVGGFWPGCRGRAARPRALRPRDVRERRPARVRQGARGGESEVVLPADAGAERGRGDGRGGDAGLGSAHDSPNFLVGLGVLHQMGIVPNVLVDPNPWEPWTSPSLEEALVDDQASARARDL